MPSSPNTLVNPEQVAGNAESVLKALSAKQLTPTVVTLRYEDLGTTATGPQFSLREITATVTGGE